MTEYGMFPVSVIIAGFCVMSLAYLICFCCCIIQFFVRRNRALGSGINNPSVETGVTKQKNDKLKNQFCRQYLNSLKRFNRNRAPDQVQADSSCVGFCPICFEEYKGDPADNFVGLIKTCGHFFHFCCIWEWLENHQTCPLCRGSTKLRESDIKGLSLRHVEAYKECALALEKTGSVVKKAPSDGVVEAETAENSESYPPPAGATPEAALEATEDADSSTSGAAVVGDTESVAPGGTESMVQGGTESMVPGGTESVAPGGTESVVAVSASCIVVAVDIEDSDLSSRGQTTTTTTTTKDPHPESSYQVAVLTPREDSRNLTMSHDNPAFVIDEMT